MPKGTSYTQYPAAPAILAHTKVEGRAIDADLDTSLQMKIHDALWMLTQQWRVGEFKGMDGGSAVRAKVNAKESMINRFQPFKNTNAIAYGQDKPLETCAENLPLNPDLLLKVQLGKYFLKVLKQIQNSETFFNLFKEYFPISLPESTDYQTLSNKPLIGLLTIFKGAILDGYALYKAIANGATPDELLTSPDPLSLPMTLTYEQRIPIIDACTRFKNWVEKSYNIPNESNICWSESSLDYRFKISTPVDITSNSDQVVMNSDSFRNGDLDWYDFDLSNTINDSLTESGVGISNLNIGGGSNLVIKNQTFSYIPSPIEFRGMPVARWWEYEHANLDIAGDILQKQDMLKMMVNSFGLNYSNDWFIVPIKAEIGGFCEIKNLMVTDVFGNHSMVKAAGTGQDNEWQRWSMFNLNKKGGEPVPGDIRLFLPPVIINRMESEPIEKVIFLKDEMANMVWAIEDIVPDGINGGMEGKLAELNLHNYFIQINKYELVSNSTTPNNAEMVFKITNALPENWIPFIPVKVNANGRAIQYRRATFKRVVNNIDTADSVSPRTYILRPDEMNPYFINEEEILKSGTIVATTFQRARWYNGEVITWLGRNRTTGRGPGRSGLKFDRMETKV